MAALAMTATLPGRTHGLGLISKPLLEELAISETHFAMVNLWSTLLGAAFAVPMGILIDRLGVRRLSVGVLLALSVSVYWLSIVSNSLQLFLCLVMTRGLGQSALSTVSIAMVSKWFHRRIALAMGLFAVLLTLGFISTVLGVGWMVGQWGWRSSWQVIAAGLLLAVPLFAIVVRSTPEACNLVPDQDMVSPSLDAALDDRLPAQERTLSETLRTKSFWIITFATSTFNFVWSSITLFNELILVELGFNQRAAVEMMAYLTGIGLVSNLIAGKLVTKRSLGGLLGCSMLIMGFALSLFPHINSLNQLRVYGAVMGLVGGFITVVHFSAWGQLYGRGAVGSIQGVAQTATVLASAIGPLCIAWFADSYSSHLPAFYVMAGLACTMAALSFLLPVLEPVDLNPNKRR